MESSPEKVIKSSAENQNSETVKEDIPCDANDTSSKINEQGSDQEVQSVTIQIKSAGSTSEAIEEKVFDGEQNQNDDTASTNNSKGGNSDIETEMTTEKTESTKNETQEIEVSVSSEKVEEADPSKITATQTLMTNESETTTVNEEIDTLKEAEKVDSISTDSDQLSVAHETQEKYVSKENRLSSIDSEENSTSKGNQIVTVDEKIKKFAEGEVKADQDETGSESAEETQTQSDSEDGKIEAEPLSTKLDETEVEQTVNEPPTIPEPGITKDFNGQIQDIICDIDSNIRAQEKIAILKEQELQLIQKQQELANHIQQQKILAQQLTIQNQLKEQELQAQQRKQQEWQQLYQRNTPKEGFPIHTYENLYNRQEDFSKESTNVSKTVDLRKIFTPATDAPEILPKNRKLYASSAFYSPTIHPTVEDQVELARRISHSLSDISNQKSKGQSMYVNRKKRSVKWVHEGCAQGQDDITENSGHLKENTESGIAPEITKLDKMPLKLIMNPRGQVRDYNSLKDSINIETGLLSPENCAELITALQLHKGRGAELFSKRRRRADNWVVDETNAGTHSPSGIPDYQHYQPKPSTSPNILPAYSDAGKHRVQLNLHQDQMIEKYSKPGVQVIKSPWEAALQTGSASSAFLEESKYNNQTTPVASPIYLNRDAVDLPSPCAITSSNNANYGTSTTSLMPTQNNQKPHANNFDNNICRTDNRRLQNQPIAINPQRELAYKPSVAQGWRGPYVELPKGLYVPKEISLASYAPPPTPSQQLKPELHSSFGQGHGLSMTDRGNSSICPITYATSSSGAVGTSSGFPILSKPSAYSTAVPPKQQLYDSASYQKFPHSMNQLPPHVNFSPSPLSFDKLSKFESSDKKNSSHQNQRHLNLCCHSNVRNSSPTPFKSTGSTPNYNFPLPQQLPQSKPKWQQNSDETTGSYGGQSFNNCARGWGMGSEQRHNNFLAQGVSFTEALPYSDF